MTRRAAAGLGRLLPLLPIAAAVVVIVAGAVLLAACGGSSGGSTPRPTATVTVTPSGTGDGDGLAVRLAVAVGLAGADHASAVLPARREARRRRAPRRAHHDAGHGGDEGAARRPDLAPSRPPGLTSAVPDGTRAPRPHHRRLDVARVDLSDAVRLRRRQPVDDGARRRRSSTRSPGSRPCGSVEFLRRTASRVEALGGEGIVLARPRRRADWRELRAGHLRRVARASAPWSQQPVHALGHGQRLRGHRSRRVSSTRPGGASSTCAVQASRGAPGRGRFAKEIAFSHVGQARHARRLRPVHGGRLAPGRGAHPRQLSPTDAGPDRPTRAAARCGRRLQRPARRESWRGVRESHPPTWV